MKKFLIFIFFISLLILGSHYFFTEMFTLKRAVVLVPTSILILISIFGVFRFAKRNIINTKHS